MTSIKRSPLLSGRGHLLQSPSEGISIVFTSIKRSLHKRKPYERALNVVILNQKQLFLFTNDRDVKLLLSPFYLVWCCSDVKFVFHWHLFKPVEPVLNGQPVLSGQLAIHQGWPFNTGLTVFRVFLFRNNPKRTRPEILAITIWAH